MRLLLSFLACAWMSAAAAPAEPFFRENDIVSLVGGEDMVLAAEQGDLELALEAGNPTLFLRFRSLAREGDTVLEQHRDLNYPPLDAQLASTGTTVIIAKFGQMEHLAQPNGQAEFITAYERLMDRLAPGGSRRVVLIASAAERDAIVALGQRRGWPVAVLPDRADALARDGVHLNIEGQKLLAQEVARVLGVAPRVPARVSVDSLRAMIQAKNRLWFHYYRPQNWAFLAGDRVDQPSSHDHLDPSKRWFPGEMQQFLPLIATKESEIYSAVADLP